MKKKKIKNLNNQDHRLLVERLRRIIYKINPEKQPEVYRQLEEQAKEHERALIVHKRRKFIMKVR
jgi:hypothetical protein